jgi:S-adenosylmethionine/arginine decarboxylase-like enzyme
MHMLCEGIADPERLNSYNRIEDFLRILPDKIEMTRITPPMVQPREEGGFVGVVLIAESHIIIHTQGNTYFLDVFSCKDFNTEEVGLLIGETFLPVGGRVQILDRGNLPEVPHAFRA